MFYLVYEDETPVRMKSGELFIYSQRRLAQIAKAALEQHLKKRLYIKEYDD